MKRMHTLVMGLVVAGVVAGAASARADEGTDQGVQQGKTIEPKPQTTCPVMGSKINKDLYVDHEGKRIYLCCKGCIAPVKEDPAKYIKVVEEAGETVAKLQTTCPVMGGKINKQQYADVKGKRIYVCCPGCIGKIEADPDKYIQELENDGVVLDAAAAATGHSEGSESHKGHNH